MSIAVRGLKEAQEKLRNMAAKTAKSYVRKAMREGLKPMLTQARADAPAKTGTARRSIRISGGKGGKTKIALRISFSKKAVHGKEGYGEFLNEGHFTGRRIRKGLAASNVRSRAHGGQSFREAVKAEYSRLSHASGRKFIPGKHFLQRAFESKRGQAVAIFVARLWEMIQSDLK